MTALAGRPEVFRVLLFVAALAVGALFCVLRSLRRAAALEEAEMVLRRELEPYEEAEKDREVGRPIR